MLDTIPREPQDPKPQDVHPLWTERAHIIRHGRRGGGVVEMAQLSPEVGEFFAWILGESRGAVELPGATALEQKYLDGEPLTDGERVTLEEWYARFTQRRAA